MTSKKVSKNTENTNFNVSEALFNVMIRNASTTEKRLMRHVKAAREAYNGGIIDDILWIYEKFQQEDEMTKEDLLPEFVIAFLKNKFHDEVEQSVTCMVASPKNE